MRKCTERAHYVNAYLQRVAGTDHCDIAAMSERTQIKEYYEAVKATGLSYAQWGQRANVAPSNMSRFAKHHRTTPIPKPETLRPLVESAPPSVAVPPAVKRIIGEMPPLLDRPQLVELSDTEYAAIGRFDADLSAGPGSLLEADPEPMGFHLLESQWLRTVSRADPEKLAVVRVAGDSMESTLHDGDWVLVDLTKKRASREGIYALRVGADLWVKRITLDLANKRVLILSDNKHYPVQALDGGELEIIGRVVWIVARRV